MPMPAYTNRRKTRGGAGVKSKGQSISIESLSNNGSSPDLTKKVEYAEDPWHSDDTPFCQLLADIAHEILPEIKTNSECKVLKDEGNNNNAIVGLANLVRDQLITERQTELANTVSKKKKKKKKKKKGKSSAEEVLTNESPSVEMPKENKPAEKEEDAAEEPPQANPADQQDPIRNSPDTPETRQQTIKRFLDQKIDSLQLKPKLGAENSFRAFLESVHSQQSECIENRHNQKQRSKTSKVEYSCHVHFSEVQASIAAIACPTCRSKVRKIFNKDFCLPVMSPFTEEAKDEDEDQAFDYVAMEEGVIPNNNSNSNKLDNNGGLVFQLVTKKNNSYEIGNQLEPLSGWQLQRRGESPTEKTRNPWTPEDIEFMMKEYVVMSGFHSDSLTGAVNLSHDKMSSITETVEPRVLDAGKRFKAMAVDLAEQFEKFVERQAEDQNNTSSGGFSFDARTFPNMQDTDNLLCDIVQRLFDFVIEVTSFVQRIVAQYQASKTMCRDDILAACKWAISPCEQLWEILWKGIGNIMTEIEKYEKELFAFQDRLGNIPAMFNNANCRAVYRRLIEEKMKIVYGMIAKCEQVTQKQTAIDGIGSEGWSTCFLRKLFTMESFCKHLSIEGPGIKSAAMDPSIGTKCKELSSSCINTVHKGTVQQILDAHSNEVTKLSSFLDSVKEQRRNSGSWKKLCANIETIQTELLDSHRIKPHMCTNITEACHSMIYNSEDFADMNEAECKAEASTLLMPLSLRRWMVRDSSSGFDCDGGNGRLRAVGVLVGLFLKGWLADRYKEWHARRSEEELLNALENELSKPSLQTVSASEAPLESKSKKPKKKKKSKATSVEIVSNEVKERDNTEKTEIRSVAETSESSEQDVSQIREVPLDVADEQNQLRPNDSVHSMSASERNSTEVVNAIVDMEVKFGAAAEENTDLNATTYAEDIAEAVTKEAENFSADGFSSLSDVEDQVNVIVHNRYGFQSAENFLLERLIATLQDKNVVYL